jgi:cytochrome c-type biogenesis protein CcmH
MTAPGRTPGPRWVRWIPWVLLGAVAVGILVVGTHRDRGHPTVAAETLHIAAMVRCPVCEGQSAAQSDAPASVQIRAQIQRELQAGEHQGQILAGLVAAYGPGILEQPEARGVDLIVWVVPVIAVVLAIAGLALAFARWRARPSLTVSDDDRALVEAALNRGTESTASDPVPPGSSRREARDGQDG